MVATIVAMNKYLCLKCRQFLYINVGQSNFNFQYVCEKYFSSGDFIPGFETEIYYTVSCTYSSKQLLTILH